MSQKTNPSPPDTSVGVLLLRAEERQVAPTGLINVNNHYPYKQVAPTELLAA